MGTITTFTIFTHALHPPQSCVSDSRLSSLCAPSS